VHDRARSGPAPRAAPSHAAAPPHAKAELVHLDLLLLNVRRVLGIGVLGLVEAVHAAVGGTALALPRVLESDSGDQRGGEPREERELVDEAPGADDSSGG
jgi:hypothetical protein